jgi:hypothetical protein
LEIAHMLATSFHEEFEAFLPKIKEAARFAFRRLNGTDRAEAVADLTAAIWSSWSGLIKRGRNPLEVGPSGILNFALKYVTSGRKLGNRTCGRGAMDIQHPRAQRACGYRVVGLDRDAVRERGPGSDAWREWLACDNRVGPADEACFQLDFAAWLGGLSEKKRRVAELLALGHRTKQVARELKVIAGAISQTRVQLAKSWEKFQQNSTA